MLSLTRLYYFTSLVLTIFFQISFMKSAFTSEKVDDIASRICFSQPEEKNLIESVIESDRDLLKTQCVEALKLKNYWFCDGDSFSTLPFFLKSEWKIFSDCWDRLKLDHYMGDGGVYRFRRYGAFRLLSDRKELELQPHAPYIQPSYINSLNGGIERIFDPLEPEFINHKFLYGLLIWCTESFNILSDYIGDWDIRIHPYRIIAEQESVGYPTPEGLHRDGVDYILTMMIQRCNIKGGETLITDSTKTPLWKGTLNLPLDIVVADDVQTRHSVTCIERNDISRSGYRDVLVVAFSRLQ